jgi:small-conductance mechanosensitive channel
LDFQLRVWIDDIDYINVVRSELNQGIDRKFRERGIEIPFPQRDLHLRSVDPPVTMTLSTFAK